MSTFSTTKSFQYINDTNLIVEDLKNHFQNKGYEVITEPLHSNGWYVSLNKGGIFKSVLGLKTSLNVDITPNGNLITATAKVGIFGQQLLPSAITWFVAWPIIITQIWGLVEQSKLDDEVMNCIEQSIEKYKNSNVSSVRSEDSVFCVECGNQLSSDFAFCPKCGAKRV